MPGIYPAKNKAEIEVPPLTKENKIKAPLGGINCPEGAEAIFTAAEYLLSYPSFSCKDAIVPPIAAAAAPDEPEILTKSV